MHAGKTRQAALLIMKHFPRGMNTRNFTRAKEWLVKLDYVL